MAYKSDCQESQWESEERKHYCLILKAQKAFNLRTLKTEYRKQKKFCK